MDFKKRIEELIDLLDKYNYYYYTLDDPIVSDKEYDKLYDELKKLEIENNYVLSYSPTQRVGGEILKSFKKHKHLARLWSLDKAQSYDELREWHNKNVRFVRDYNRKNQDKLPEPEYILEYKFDGLTVNLTYDNRELVNGATRGNGEVGEEILAQLKTIKTIPLRVVYEGKFEAQGEGIMPLSQLKKYNENNDIELKNARNAAAGALRNLDPKETEKRKLEAFFYNVNYIEGIEFKKQEEMIKFLEENRFLTSKYNKKFTVFEELISEIKSFEEERNKLDFLTDGMVIKINDIRTQKLMAYTNKFPKWAIAFKFEAKEASSRIIKVIWNVGRSAKVTPSAILEPVEIGGVTVQRATLNNMDDIRRKNIHLNERVLIRRSNDVIPEILGPLKTQEEIYDIKEPSYCPSCGSALYKDGVHIFCPNSLSCKPQLIKRMVHFASKEAMNIEGFNEKTAQKIFDSLNMSDISDIYKLKKDDLLNLEGFKDKKSENMIDAIEKSKIVELKNFIYALGIPNVGIKTASDLAKYYISFNNFRKADYAQLKEISDIGPVTAKEIEVFLSDEKIKLSIENLLNSGIIVMDYSQKTKKNSFSDKTIVITGSFEDYTRKELSEMLEKYGAKVSSSVSRQTDYVLVGENPGSKRDKAVSLGVKIINLDEFKEMM